MAILTPLLLAQKYLAKFGYLQKDDLEQSADNLRNALKDFQGMAGLEITGESWIGMF